LKIMLILYNLFFLTKAIQWNCYDLKFNKFFWIFKKY
jgi:hypothetical protein